MARRLDAREQMMAFAAFGGFADNVHACEAGASLSEWRGKKFEGRQIQRSRYCRAPRILTTPLSG
jgi:hypothetical protein